MEEKFFLWQYQALRTYNDDNQCTGTVYWFMGIEIEVQYFNFQMDTNRVYIRVFQKGELIATYWCNHFEILDLREKEVSK